MKIAYLILVISVVAAGVIITPLASEQLVTAKTIKKVHFTQTITSSQDPGEGHTEYQFALVLPPNAGTIYDGSITYASSSPVQVLVLHEVQPGRVMGQPVWSVDGITQYALSVLGTAEGSGSSEFTGAAVALRSNGTAFTATVSVDGWVRGEPVEIGTQGMQEDVKLRLARANVPATLPLHAGLYEGEEVLYMVTDSSDEMEADRITMRQKWRVETAPPLSDAPEESLAGVYTFVNGVAGGGLYGYQGEVFSDTPAQEDQYSALRKVSTIQWKNIHRAEVLNSVEEILEAAEKERVEIEETKIILNMPQIKWPEGQMPILDAEITDEMEYGKAQVTNINEENMTVTFVAHRGWGPDGATIYYIVTDATPAGPAEIMGVANSPRSASLLVSAASADLFQFKNGISGSGPLGFQPEIRSVAPGDESYTPLWRILLVEWKDPSNASLLETRSDIDALHGEEMITTSLARPMNSDHIINSPLIDPFQTLE